ncbi:hypothetical protein GF342_03620 [Candidatus Woesearchaeota archaeon]|nr:hypothetical protein [Candidatus Woesearchaeota archaeon]
MDEVARTRKALEKIMVSCANQRDSPLGKFLTDNGDHMSFDTFDIFFNRNQKNEQIDVQVKSYIFNFGAWKESTHKLAELLLLKGASLSDIEELSHRVIQTRADNS